jgi:hypothetical protein
MKRILNTLIIILIMLLTISGCKNLIKTEITPVAMMVTPVRETTPVSISNPTQLPFIVIRASAIPAKTPTNPPESVKTAHKKGTYVFVKKWGSKGSGDGQFKNPDNNIAVDHNGNLYITDSGNCRIQKFDSNGKFILKWNSASPGNGKFKHFNRIAVDSDNNIYVTEVEDGDLHLRRLSIPFGGDVNTVLRPTPRIKYDGTEEINTIQKFTSDGKFITKCVTKDPPVRILVSRDKKVYGIIYNSICRFDSKGNITKTWHMPFVKRGKYPNQDICDIVIDSKNNIFALIAGLPVYIYPNFDKPVNPGEYYIVGINSKGQIIEGYKNLYDEKKNKLDVSEIIAIDSKDNIFISGRAAYPCIFKFDPNLKFITKFGSKDPGNGQLKKIGSIAVDSESNVYVVDIGDFCIKKFAPKQ